MRVIVVGYGRVGSWTAHVLTEEGHEVTVVDNDPDKVERARERGFAVVEGDGREDRVLEEAGVDAAASVGALTGDPNVNFAVCMLAKDHGCRTVMRISEDYRSDIYDQYADAVDEVVYPEQFGAAGAKTALLGGDFDAIGELTERLSLSVVHVPDDAPVVGERVTDLDFGSDAAVYAHGHDREPMTIPLPGTTVEPGDRLALVVDRDAESTVRAALVGGSG
jgi:trk system potassium uptake protein TrkA